MLEEPRCSKRNCRHFEGARWLGDDEPTEVVVCRAFPDGIPSEIAYGDNPHTEPYRGDSGIRFEQGE